jgi:predicted cobalt transporter CbtA
MGKVICSSKIASDTSHGHIFGFLVGRVRSLGCQDGGQAGLKVVTFVKLLVPARLPTLQDWSKLTVYCYWWVNQVLSEKTGVTLLTRASQFSFM